MLSARFFLSFMMRAMSAACDGVERERGIV
jgi:hypothetical protein